MSEFLWNSGRKEGLIWPEISVTAGGENTEKRSVVKQVSRQSSQRGVSNPTVLACRQTEKCGKILARKMYTVNIRKGLRSQIFNHFVSPFAHQRMLQLLGTNGRTDGLMMKAYNVEDKVEGQDLREGEKKVVKF